MAESYLAGLHSSEGRKALTEALLALFRQWDLTEAEQARLLGMSQVDTLWQGEALEDEAGVLERAGMILGIERAIQRVFADQPMMRERWINVPNIWLQGKVPLQMMLQGEEGIRQVYALFEHESETHEGSTVDE